MEISSEKRNQARNYTARRLSDKGAGSDVAEAHAHGVRAVQRQVRFRQAEVRLDTLLLVGAEIGDRSRAVVHVGEAVRTAERAPRAVQRAKRLRVEARRAAGASGRRAATRRRGTAGGRAATRAALAAGSSARPTRPAAAGARGARAAVIAIVAACHTRAQREDHRSNAQPSQLFHE